MPYVHVKVKTGAHKESFKMVSSDHFEISVKEKAERNQANARVLELLAGYFKIPRNLVKLVKGHKRPSKLIAVEK